jgi:hypothetical protein
VQEGCAPRKRSHLFVNQIDLQRHSRHEHCQHFLPSVCNAFARVYGSSCRVLNVVSPPFGKRIDDECFDFQFALQHGIFEMTGDYVKTTYNLYHDLFLNGSNLFLALVLTPTHFTLHSLPGCAVKKHWYHGI